MVAEASPTLDAGTIVEFNELAILIVLAIFR